MSYFDSGEVFAAPYHHAQARVHDPPKGDGALGSRNVPGQLLRGLSTGTDFMVPNQTNGAPPTRIVDENPDRLLLIVRCESAGILIGGADTRCDETTSRGQTLLSGQGVVLDRYRGPLYAVCNQPAAGAVSHVSWLEVLRV